MFRTGSLPRTGCRHSAPPYRIYRYLMMDQQPRLLALTSDFVFRALFTRSLTSLTDLLNAALGFSGAEWIETLTLLPTEIHKEHAADKSVVLDIKARSHGGELFNIEMQALEQSFYSARALYYWARLYTGQLGQGEDYTTLQRTYSVNFLNFNLLDLPRYQSRFMILERDHPEIQLTDKFQMLFFELPKFDRRLDKLENNLELWLYIMKPRVTSDEAAYCTLDEAEMRTIIDKNPVMEETFKVWRELSVDPEILSLEEARRKGQLDYNTNMLVSRAEGRAEGKAEGKIESARVMLEKEYPLQEISEITGLTPEQLRDAGLIR